MHFSFFQLKKIVYAMLLLMYSNNAATVFFL